MSTLRKQRVQRAPKPTWTENANVHAHVGIACASVAPFAGEGSVERVLIAGRGEIARRLIRHYRALDIETVCVFSEPDVDAPWCEEADYEVYLNGRTVDETYMNPQRLISACMDSGCQAIHPGYNFLAERPELFDLAARANVPVIGADPKALMRAQDRMGLRAAADSVGIALIPASDVLPKGEDGVAAGAQLGFPLFVKSVAAGIFLPVNKQADIAEAVAAVRRWGERLEGDGRVYLERRVDEFRHIGTVVVGDHHGTTAFLGHTDGSIKSNYHTWLEEMGTNVVSAEVSERLGTHAVALARALGWSGVGRVSWAITPDGGVYLMGFSCRLTTGFSLVEAVYGVDLITTQYRVCSGNPLGWDGMATAPNHFGLQLRILHMDPATGARPEGTITAFDMPQGITVDEGLELGFNCTADTEPLLAKLTVVAPTRHAALVRAKAALEETVIEGIPTNREVLLALLGEEAYWRGQYNTSTLPTLLGLP